jgi:hypothetical protein
MGIVLAVSLVMLTRSFVGRGATECERGDDEDASSPSGSALRKIGLSDEEE